MTVSRQQHSKAADISKGVSAVYCTEPGFHEKPMKEAVRDANPDEHWFNQFATAVMGEDPGRPSRRGNILEMLSQ